MIEAVQHKPAKNTLTLTGALDGKTACERLQDLFEEPLRAAEERKRNLQNSSSGNRAGSATGGNDRTP